MNQKVNSVEEYIEINQAKSPILSKLRALLNSTELSETLKWRIPCYTINGKNVVGLGTTKKYTGLWFFNGALLTDPKKRLVNAQEGKTEALRQLRFPVLVKEVDEKMVMSFILEAIDNQKAGKEVKHKKKPLIIPPLLEKALEKNQLVDIFESLSLTSKRDYAEYIELAKREETKLSRLDKILPMIKSGIGLNDKYK